MSYGTKYRASYVDFYSRAIQVDLKKIDYTGSATAIKPAYPSLSIEWPGNRDDIFCAVRGGMAVFNVYAESSNQFDEFFDALEKDWIMEVSVSGSVYWSGYVMVGEHQEAFRGAPYMVSFRAFDLGYLQDVNYDNTDSGDDSIIDVIQKCLANTGLNLEVKERVNVYEDSISSSSASHTPLNQINIHQASLMNGDWEGLNCYEVLERELIPLTSFIMQENGVWNICRVPDLKYTHNYRVFNTSGAVTSSGSEDLVKPLSDYKVINNSGLMMASETWKELPFYQDYGLGSLVDNGKFMQDLTLTDYWTKVGAGSIGLQSGDTITSKRLNGEITGYAVVMGQGTGSDTVTMTQTKTYSVESGNAVRLKVRYRFAFWKSGGSGTPEGGFRVLNTVGSVPHYLQMDGSWGGASTDTDNISSTIYEWQEGEFLSEEFDGTGTLTFDIIDVRGITGASVMQTFYDYFEVFPVVGSSGDVRGDLSETLNSGNLTVPSEVVIYHGDSDYTVTGRELLLGSYETTGGATTDLWQSSAGSRVDKIAQLCADCYKAQRETTARKFQSTIKGQLNYLDILEDVSERKYLPVSMTYHVDDSEWQGERIEIKTGWDDITGTFVNSSGRPYDTFSTSPGAFNIIKTQTSAEAAIDLGSTSVTEGTRYKLTINIETGSLLETYAGEIIETFDSEHLEYVGGVVNTALPEFNFAGNNKDDFTLGETVWEVLATSTTSTHANFATHQTITDTCDLIVTVKIEEAYGL